MAQMGGLGLLDLRGKGVFFRDFRCATGGLH